MLVQTKERPAIFSASEHLSTSQKQIPFVPELNILINEMSGTLRNKTDLLNSCLEIYLIGKKQPRPNEGVK